MPRPCVTRRRPLHHTHVELGGPAAHIQRRQRHARRCLLTHPDDAFSEQIPSPHSHPWQAGREGWLTGLGAAAGMAWYEAVGEWRRRVWATTLCTGREDWHTTRINVPSGGALLKIPTAGKSRLPTWRSVHARVGAERKASLAVVRFYPGDRLARV